MLRLQLFALLAVLTILDGAVLQIPKCKYHEGPHSTFCKLVIKALMANRETEHHMSVLQFGNVMQKMDKADEAIRVVLSKEQGRELLPFLCQALDSESGALFEVLRKCNNNVTQEPCAEIFRGVSYSTIKLVEATIVVTEGKQKAAVQALYTEFQEQGKPKDGVYGLVTKLLTALE